MRISGLHRTAEPTEFRLVKPFFKGNNFFDFHIFDMYKSKIRRILYVKLYVRKLEIPLETRKIQYQMICKFICIKQKIVSINAGYLEISVVMFVLPQRQKRR